MFYQRGDKMTVDEVQKIIDEVDENRDGKLNYKEVLLCISYSSISSLNCGFVHYLMKCLVISQAVL